MPNLFQPHLRLKRPCANCPFLKQGAIELAPGRLDGIIAGLIEDDHSTFQCHKTVHSARSGEWDDEGTYTPSGHESMCAGAAAYLMKHKRPTVATRVAFAMGVASPADWDDAQAMTIE
jgi:hypothetical protein